MSQNLFRYLDFPDGTVVRINLAWIDDLEKLRDIVDEIDNEIYLDVPVGRTKPPNNSYSLQDLKDIAAKPNVTYMAISNVESSQHLSDSLGLFAEMVNIVPKIETKKGLENLSDITNALVGEKIIMLDHDDLFADLIRNNVSPHDFFKYIKKIEYFCNSNSVKLLKTRGVIFSDLDSYRY